MFCGCSRDAPSEQRQRGPGRSNVVAAGEDKNPVAAEAALKLLKLKLWTLRSLFIFHCEKNGASRSSVVGTKNEIIRQSRKREEAYISSTVETKRKVVLNVIFLF